MQVYTSKVRRAYLKKRSKGQMLAATVIIAGVMGLFGLAAKSDEVASQELSGQFRMEHRRAVVATWSQPQVGEWPSAE